MGCLLIFDLDGTLIDSGKSCLQAWKAAFRDVAGLDFPKRGLLLRGNTDVGIIQAMLSGLHRDSGPEALVSAIRLRYLALLPSFLTRSCVRVQSGAIGFLERVTSWGHLAAIATGNFADAADLKLRLSGLSGHFRDVITADDAPNREAIVQRALDALTRRALVDDVQPERAYLFGDTMQDVEAARASRIAAIIVNTDCTVGDGVLLTITDFTDDRLTQLFQCDGKGMP